MTRNQCSTSTQRRQQFVPATPSAGYRQGEALYRAGKPLSQCLTDEQSAGWNDAADSDLRGALAYLRAMEAEGMPATTAALALGGL